MIQRTHSKGTVGALSRRENLLCFSTCCASQLGYIGNVANNLFNRLAETRFTNVFTKLRVLQLKNVDRVLLLDKKEEQIYFFYLVRSRAGESWATTS